MEEFPNFIISGLESLLDFIVFGLEWREKKQNHLVNIQQEV